MCKQRHVIFPAVFKLKLNSYPFRAMDIFLSNELSAGFEHLDLILITIGAFLLRNWVPVTEACSSGHLQIVHLLKGILIFRKIYLCFGEFKQH